MNLCLKWEAAVLGWGTEVCVYFLLYWLFGQLVASATKPIYLLRYMIISEMDIVKMRSSSLEYSE